MNFWDIRDLVHEKYKSGNDWVYPKGKKAEIDIIKALLNLCQHQSDKIYELEKEVEVVDPWQAYRKALCQLKEVKNLEAGMRMGLIEYETVMDNLNKAQEKVKECKDYMDTLHKQIEEKNT